MSLASFPLHRGGVLVLPANAAWLNQGAGPEALVDALEPLADAYRAGCLRILRLGGEAPERAGDADVAQMFNDLLISHGLPPMKLRDLEPGAKALSRILGWYVEVAEVSSRRTVFRAVTPLEPAPRALPQVQAVDSANPKALFAVVPVIDPLACVGCDACLRVCPEDVLTHVKAAGGDLNYTVNGGRCDGCALCQGVCAHGAVELMMATPTPPDVALSEWACRACGVVVHPPQLNPTAEELCDICAQTQHHKKLFQVLP